MFDSVPTIPTADVVFNYSPPFLIASVDFVQVALQPDRFLSELTSMYEKSTEKGSVWVTMKRSSLKNKAQLQKMEKKGKEVEYRCLVRASDGKKSISTSVLYDLPCAAFI
ncbi:hypothetical protein PR202_ga19000 [Eleusine coracana subsp. coracana]|uniref:Signal recognition particle 14 kDa protein n=1 Tax=Eleusine coracana subsp. coracana TaxID=191504 RepID=A0AAV5CUT7_ELECO|nr:hypothetical protein PR202_ga19000 [Eleusine coracana subsp. coracana]